MPETENGRIVFGDNIEVLAGIGSGSVDLIYIDPPFNTGQVQRLRSIRTDLVLDFFAGSGTTGAACLDLGRRFLLVDNHPDALSVMERRIGDAQGIVFEGWPPGGDRP